MRTIGDVYEEYKIMPQLQLHQLRVAAVAFLLCDARDEPVDTRDVVLACLFHDMGNIIKSNFDHFPDSFRGPQPRSHWEAVKEEYIRKYGPNTHQATLKIAEELKLPPAVRQLIDEISFSRLEQTRDEGTISQKITEYADLRVGPHGVISLGARIDDIRARYAGAPGSETPADERRFLQLSRAAFAIERQIFENIALQPEDLNDASVEVLLEELHKQGME